MTLVLTATAANNGEASWLDSASILGGGGSLLDTILSRARINPDVSNTYINLLSSASTSKTLTFTAPKDITIKNILCVPQFVDQSGNIAKVYNSNGQVFIQRIEVTAGTGPHVGESFISGFGVPSLLFTPQNTVFMPELNWQLAEGDTLEIDITVLQLGVNILLYNIALTYEDTLLSDTDPLYFVASPEQPISSEGTIAPQAPATGSITITGTPSVPGDTITLTGYYIENGFIQSVGGVLTGASGGAGAQEWDTDITGIENIRDEILSKLQGGSGPWDDYWIFSAVDTDQISIISRSDGPIGNISTLAESSGVITVSGATLTGGTTIPSTLTLEQPTYDLTISRVCLTLPVGASLTPNIPLYVTNTNMNDLTVDGTSVGLGSIEILPTNDVATIITADFPVDAGSDIELTIQTSASAGTIVAACMCGTRR